LILNLIQILPQHSLPYRMYCLV